MKSARPYSACLSPDTLPIAAASPLVYPPCADSEANDLRLEEQAGSATIAPGLPQPFAVQTTIQRPLFYSAPREQTTRPASQGKPQTGKLRLELSRSQARSLEKLIAVQVAAYAEAEGDPPTEPTPEFTGRDLDRLMPLLGQITIARRNETHR